MKKPENIIIALAAAIVMSTALKSFAKEDPVVDPLPDPPPGHTAVLFDWDLEESDKAINNLATRIMAQNVSNPADEPIVLATSSQSPARVFVPPGVWRLWPVNVVGVKNADGTLAQVQGPPGESIFLPIPSKPTNFKITISFGPN